MRLIPARQIAAPRFRFAFSTLLTSLLLVGFAAEPLQAQRQPRTGRPRPSNGARYDLRWFNLGFLAGANFSNMKIQYGNATAARFQAGSVRNVSISTTPGVVLGMITNFKLGKYIDFRITPGVSLEQRNFEYTFVNSEGGDSIVERKLEAAFGEVPIWFRFKSQLYRNYRVYVQVGGKWAYNFISDARAENDPDLIKIGRQNFSLEFAFGIDIYGDRVKLAPEVRYSLGLNNLYSPSQRDQNSATGNAINGLTTSTISLVFNFE